MSASASKENPSDLAPTSLSLARAVKDRLEAYGVTEPRHVEIILAVLDWHGLFHVVNTPKQGETSKEIGRRAKRIAKELLKRITNIRKAKLPPADSQEADLAERWEKIGANRLRIEELRVVSETFQISRGGRITTRYASPDSRKHNPQGRRSEPEITHALQILDHYLRMECSMRTNHRMECLGGILQSATDSKEIPQSVIERVRLRLKEADKNTPLSDTDYREAIGLTREINEDRQKIFMECMSILNSSMTSTHQKQKAEDTLQNLFSLK